MSYIDLILDNNRYNNNNNNNNNNNLMMFSLLFDNRFSKHMRVSIHNTRMRYKLELSLI